MNPCRDADPGAQVAKLVGINLNRKLHYGAEYIISFRCRRHVGELTGPTFAGFR